MCFRRSFGWITSSKWSISLLFLFLRMVSSCFFAYMEQFSSFMWKMPQGCGGCGSRCIMWIRTTTCCQMPCKMCLGHYSKLIWDHQPKKKNRHAMRACVCHLEIQQSLGKEGNASFSNEGQLRFVSVAFGFHCGHWKVSYASELLSFS